MVEFWQAASRRADEVAELGAAPREAQMLFDATRPDRSGDVLPRRVDMVPPPPGHVRGFGVLDEFTFALARARPGRNWVSFVSMTSPDRLSPWWFRVAMAAVIIVGCSASVDSLRDAGPDATVPTVPTDDPPPSPVEPVESVDSIESVDSGEWEIDEPLVDVLDLAGMHLSSGLQFDECQQNYAAISSDVLSSRNPQYFC